MKSNPEVIELDEADLESKLDQIEAVMGVEMAQPFRQLLRWYAERGQAATRKNPQGTSPLEGHRGGGRVGQQRAPYPVAQGFAHALPPGGQTRGS